MIANITTMAVSGLVFSSWGLAVNICSLLRLSKPGRCLFVPHSFNIHHTKLTIIIDCMTVLVYGFPVDGCLTANGIPLSSTSILQHLIITARSSISGSIEECSAGSVSIANLKMTIQAVRTVHVGNVALITRHEVLECRLIVLDCTLSRLKLRSMSLLLVHCASRYTSVRFDLSPMDWSHLEELVLEEIGQGLLDAGIPVAQVTAYLREVGEVQLTRTHGRREVAFLNRAWEDVLSADLLVDQTSQRQPILNHAVNDRLCRCAGEDGIDTAQAHLETYFAKRE